MGSLRTDETDNTYGKLTVVRFSHIHYFPAGGKQTFWWCRCECGREKPIRATELRRKDEKAARSCGECVKVKHGHAPSTGQSSEYVSWHAMLSRCHTPGYSGYSEYGGRGIKVCERWRESFAVFLADMGLKPTPAHTIDRYPDRDGNYEPGNCRWATKAQQSRNMRTNVLVTIGGRTQIVADWAIELGVPITTYCDRRRRGMTPKQALTTEISFAKTPEQKRAAKERAKRSLTNEQQLEAVQRVDSGESLASVARYFGVGASTIARTCGRTY